MPKSSPPPRSSIRGSPPTRRHPSPVSYTPSQRLPERAPVAIAPISTTSAPSSIYSNTSSSISSSEVSSYPSIYPERPPPPANSSLSAAAAMAPSTATTRTTMAFDMTPTSTPTGRISKAKKGKRVHACEFPGCGKVFTRAEHKRRHELNHNPDATYHCGHVGCNKSFHRPDLLQRHQERHELEATGVPPHRKFPTSTSMISEATSTMPVSALTSPQMPENTPRTSAGPISIGSLVHPQSQSYATDAFGITGVAYPPPMMWQNQSEESLFYGSDSSPMAERHPYRQSMSSASSVTGYDVTGSPMVTASMPPTQWMPGTAAPPNALSSNVFDNEYMPSHTAPPMPIPLSDMDGYEWTVIRRELSAQSGLLSSPRGTVVPDTVRWYCLDLYWQYFHSTFPIVHRPTFLPTKPSPLLACAMVAIGSYYDDKEDAKNYSLTLLEIATKILLQRRNNITSKSRTSDLQTVVLLEILSTFYARQISVQMSTRFRSLFANLNQNQRLPTNPLAVFRTLKQNHTPQELSSAHKFFVENETRSRILHACTVFDSQQALLFEQSHTIRRHTGLRVNVVSATRTINLPCDDELWDASPIEKWTQLAHQQEYIELANGKPLSNRRSSEFSFFQNQVIQAYAEQHTPSSAKSSSSSSSISRGKLPPPAPTLFDNTAFNNHVTEMCRHTPIRSLLIVTGESWILGRKTEKQTDYNQAKQELRKWIDGPTSIKRGVADSLVALWHALKVFKGLMSLPHVGPGHTGSPPILGSEELFGTTHMIHESWSVYLACLVCWAHGRRSKNNIDIPLNSTTANTVVSTSMDVKDITPAHTPNLGGVNGVGVSFSTPSRPSYVPASHSQDHTPMTPHHHGQIDASVVATQEAQTYLLFTDATSPASLRDVDASILLRTQGLLETIRTQKISRCLMGGLMNDADQVLFKLGVGKGVGIRF